MKFLVKNITKCSKIWLPAGLLGVKKLFPDHDRGRILFLQFRPGLGQIMQSIGLFFDIFLNNFFTILGQFWAIFLYS